MKTFKKLRTEKSEDNIRTKKIEGLIKELLEDVSLDFGFSQVDELEFERRDGFIPFDHNRGGVDFILFTTINELIGGGYHMDTKIYDRVDKEYLKVFNEVAEELKIDPNTDKDEDREKIYEKLDQITMDDYCGYAWRIRVMYEGENTIVVHSGWDFDAPYYRWSNKTDLEQEITFKDKRDLKAKLKKAIQKAIDNM